MVQFCVFGFGLLVFKKICSSCKIGLLEGTVGKW